MSKKPPPTTPRSRAWHILKGCIGATVVASAAIGASAWAGSTVSPFGWINNSTAAQDEFPSPTASISTDKFSNLGDQVDLKGAGESQTYQPSFKYIWTLQSQPAGSTAKLKNADQANASFVSDKPGYYKVSLVVNLAGHLSDAATAQIVVLSPVGQKGTNRATVRGAKLAVFVVDFPDTPADVKAMQPSVSTLRETFFGSLVKGYLSDMSFGQFTGLTADVYGPIRVNQPGYNVLTRQALSADTIMDSAYVFIPGFDASKYDGLVLIPLHDAVRETAWTKSTGARMHINGRVQQFKRVMYLPVAVGYPNRDRSKKLYKLDDPFPQMALVGDDMVASIRVTTPGTRAQRAFLHEFGHLLGLDATAQSRTNGTSFDYEAEVANNFWDPNNPGTTDLLAFDNGNRFDAMGSGDFTMNLNHVYRNFFGWHNSSNLKSIRSGTPTQTVTIYPSHATAGVRAVEIRIPYQYGVGADTAQNKNQGYFLEVHSAASRWDASLADPVLKGNNDGIFVYKTDGYTSRLLDMSPSANLYTGRNDPDILDVVLKPGMSYSNLDLQLTNVRKNADGSFTLDVSVYQVIID